MTRNIINVKPIKDKQVMLEFLSELKKRKTWKKRPTDFCDWYLYRFKGI